VLELSRTGLRRGLNVVELQGSAGDTPFELLAIDPA
jgi:hypothetical protein